MFKSEKERWEERRFAITVSESSRTGCWSPDVDVDATPFALVLIVYEPDPIEEPAEAEVFGNPIEGPASAEVETLSCNPIEAPASAEAEISGTTSGPKVTGL